MGSIKVFGLPTSTDVARVLTCLFEKELEFQLIRIDTYKGKRKVPEFLRLQDISGQVTFKDEEKMLLDSREICRYIADYPTSEPSTKKLLGTGILERASVEQWLQAESENFEPPSSALVFHLAFAVPMAHKVPMASVKVFGSPTSAEVARVLTCLFEKDVEFQLIRVENFKGRERKPEYLKLQASGQALTFEDGSVTLVDSRAICRHLAEKYADQGNKNLIGSGTLERASIEQWLQTEAESFEPPSSSLVFHLAFAPYIGLEPDETVVKESLRKLERVLNIYEQRLEETSYLAGDNFTLADLSHLPNAHRIMTKLPQHAKLFMGRKRVSKWWEKISGRKSWKKVVEMQKESPVEA